MDNITSIYTTESKEPLNFTMSDQNLFKKIEEGEYEQALIIFKGMSKDFSDVKTVISENGNDVEYNILEYATVTFSRNYDQNKQSKFEEFVEEVIRYRNTNIDLTNPDLTNPDLNLGNCRSLYFAVTERAYNITKFLIEECSYDPLAFHESLANGNIETILDVIVRRNYVDHNGEKLRGEFLDLLLQSALKKYESKEVSLEELCNYLFSGLFFSFLDFPDQITNEDYDDFIKAQVVADKILRVQFNLNGKSISLLDVNIRNIACCEAKDLTPIMAASYTRGVHLFDYLYHKLNNKLGYNSSDRPDLNLINIDGHTAFSMALLPNGTPNDSLIMSMIGSLLEKGAKPILYYPKPGQSGGIDGESKGEYSASKFDIVDFSVDGISFDKLKSLLEKEYEDGVGIDHVRLKQIMIFAMVMASNRNYKERYKKAHSNSLKVFNDATSYVLTSKDMSGFELEVISDLISFSSGVVRNKIIGSIINAIRNVPGLFTKHSRIYDILAYALDEHNEALLDFCTEYYESYTRNSVYKVNPISLSSLKSRKSLVLLRDSVTVPRDNGSSFDITDKLVSKIEAFISKKPNKQLDKFQKFIDDIIQYLVQQTDNGLEIKLANRLKELLFYGCVRDCESGSGEFLKLMHTSLENCDDYRRIIRKILSNENMLVLLSTKAAVNSENSNEIIDLILKFDGSGPKTVLCSAIEKENYKILEILARAYTRNKIEYSSEELQYITGDLLPKINKRLSSVDDHKPLLSIENLTAELLDGQIIIFFKAQEQSAEIKNAADNIVQQITEKISLLDLLEKFPQLFIQKQVTVEKKDFGTAVDTANVSLDFAARITKGRCLG